MEGRGCSHRALSSVVSNYRSAGLLVPDHGTCAIDLSSGVSQVGSGPHRARLADTATQQQARLLARPHFLSRWLSLSHSSSLSLSVCLSVCLSCLSLYVSVSAPPLSLSRIILSAFAPFDSTSVSLPLTLLFLYFLSVHRLTRS